MDVSASHHASRTLLDGSTPTRSSESAHTASGPSGSSSLTSATVSVGAPLASGVEYSV